LEFVVLRMDEISENLEDSILYELLVFSEWSQEQDVIVGLIIYYTTF
jgi:hypothetical protein